MFVNGTLRKSDDITALQEYSTWCDSGSYGRPDIFFNYERNAIWVEAKYLDDPRITEDHWNVSTWLKWDQSFAFQQAAKYYNWEHKDLNSCYQKRFIMTLMFKKLQNDPETHFKAAFENLMPDSQKKDWDRGWYYDVLYIVNERDKPEGIEVYGTFQEAGEALKSLNLPTIPTQVG